MRIMFPTESNAVFAELPLPAIEDLALRARLFYTFIGAGGCRLVCARGTCSPRPWKRSPPISARPAPL